MAGLSLGGEGGGMEPWGDDIITTFFLPNILLGPGPLSTTGKLAREPHTGPRAGPRYTQPGGSGWGQVLGSLRRGLGSSPLRCSNMVGLPTNLLQWASRPNRARRESLWRVCHRGRWLPSP